MHGVILVLLAVVNADKSKLSPREHWVFIIISDGFICSLCWQMHLHSVVQQYSVKLWSLVHVDEMAGNGPCHKYKCNAILDPG